MSRLLFLVSLLSIGFSQEVIAVSDITSEGLSNIQKKQFFNKLESDLVNLGAYEVTSRSEVDKILAEQKFQSAGCTDQQCAAEIGRLLNADLMLLSDILYDPKNGDLSITIKLIDVETAKIATSISKFESIKNIQDVFDKIPNYLLELYRNQNKDRTSAFTQTPAQQEEKGTGTLKVISDPIGAKVILDNEDVGLTPVEKNLEAGKHRLILTYDGYERFAKSVTIITDSTETVQAELVSLTGDLTINSTPSNSDVFINDEFKGKSPLTLKYMEVGEYFIKISQSGYQDEIAKVSVEWNQLNTVNKTLKSLPGSVAFYSVPDDVEVLVDGRPKGQTTMSGLILELSAGKHTITMKKKGYITEKSEIEVHPGEATDIELSLAKRPQGVSNDPNVGWASISGAPENSAITLQGKQYPSPLKYHELRKGSYNFKAVRDGYKTKTIPFKVNAQKHSEYTFKLDPIDRKKAKKLSLMFPGLGHMYAEKQSKGIIWMALGAGSLGATLSMISQYLSDADAYISAESDYLSETDPDEITRKFSIYNNLKDEKLKGLIGSSVCGVATLTVWIWNTYDLNKSMPSIFDMPIDIGMTKQGNIKASVSF